MKNTSREWHSEPDDEVLQYPEAEQCDNNKEHHLSANVRVSCLESILLVCEETKDERGRTRDDVCNKLIYTERCQ